MLDKIGYINSIDYDGLARKLSVMDKEQRNKTFWTNGIYIIFKVNQNYLSTKIK